MTQFLLPPGFRATDADDNPLAGGYYKFYAGGTTTPKAVFSDAALSTSLGTQVNLNSAGAPVSGSNTPVLIYLNTGTYKAELYDADDTLLFTFDAIPGADEEEAEVTTALPTTPVISKTGAYTVTVNERGKLINANPTGGSFAITLPSAVTMGDDFVVGIRHSGSANQVAVVSSGSQFIRADQALRAFPLPSPGEVVWLSSDGSDWIVKSHTREKTPYFIVLDRLTAPPANPDAGACYLLNGEPSGLWATLSFEENDIAKADGNGSWIRYTPEPGWMAFDVDEEVTLQFKNDAWENFQIDPGTSTLNSLVVQDQKSSGTHGGTATTGAWTTAVLNTSVTNEITGSSLASNKITLPAGTYEVEAAKTFFMTKLSRIRFKTADDDSIIIEAPQAYIGDDDSNSDQRSEAGAVLYLKGRFTIATATDFILQYRCTENPTSGSLSGRGLGHAMSLSPEVYATVSILDLASLQGPKGDQGDQGNPGPQGDTGPAGVLGPTNFNFDSSTTDADPGSGDLRLNNATPASATTIYIDNNNRGGVDVSAWIDTFDDAGASGMRGYLVIMDALTASTVFRIYSVTGSVVDGTGYRKVSVTHLAGGGSFTNGNEILVTFFPRGPSGSGLADIVDDTSPQLGGNLDLNGFTIGPSGAVHYANIPQQSKSADYTLVLSDANQHILHPAADTNNRTFTIPANASVAFPVGTVITFINEVNTVTIAITSDTLTLAGLGTTGSRSLAANGFAMAIKVTSTKWMISGVGLT